MTYYLLRMKTKDDITRDLDQLIEKHYYSENYELEWAAKNYQDSLAHEEQRPFKEALLERVVSDPSLANITLCARLRIPALAPILSLALNYETRTSQQSRAIMSALEHYGDDESYRAVERFMDSDQEGETLMRLCRMDFERSYPYLRRALKKEPLKGFCLQAFHERRKTAGLDTLIGDLNNIVRSNPPLYVECVRSTLRHKQDDYNPFSRDEIASIENALPLSET